MDKKVTRMDNIADLGGGVCSDCAIVPSASSLITSATQGCHENFSESSSFKVLHVIFGLLRGGIEVWLMNLLRIKPANVQFDFMVTTQGTFDEEARSLGAHIHYVCSKMKIGQYLRQFEEVLAKNNYDVVHIHSDEFTGNMMKIAARCNVPVRIVHSHATVLARGRKVPLRLLRKIHFHTLNRWSIKKYATHVLACSDAAGKFMMGRFWKGKQCSVLFCGTPTTRFEQPMLLQHRETLCAQYGIPFQNKVLGHVGSLTPPKNQRWMIHTFAELVKRHDHWSLVIIGDGELRDELRQTIKELNLADHVFMLGESDDIPNLMINLFDAFWLPSSFEGFGIVMIEAVAAGLSAVSSSVLPKDLFDNLPAEKTQAIDLDAPLLFWEEALAQAIERKGTSQEGIEIIQRSPFSVNNSLQALLDLYKIALKKR